MKGSSPARRTGAKTPTTTNGSKKNARVSLSPAAATKAAESSMPQKDDLAERLELLEARLRQPMTSGQQQQQSLPGGQTNNDQQSNGSMLTALQSPTLSQHSFTFDAPTMSHSSFNNHQHSNLSGFSSTSTGHNHSSKNAAQQNQNNKRRRTSASSLDAVNQAADQHIRKMAALEQETNSQGGEGGLSTRNNNNSISNASHQTLRTSHRAAQVVKETPPAPPPNAAPRGGNPRALMVTTDNNAATTTNKRGDKRKSTPVKKEGPAIRARKSGTGNNATKINNNSSTTTDTRKRTRLQFTNDNNNETNQNNAANSATASNKASSPAPNNHSNSSRSNPSTNKVGSTAANKASKVPKNNKLIRDFFTAARTNNAKGAAVKALQSQQPQKAPGTPPPASLRAAGLSSPGTPSPNTQVAQLRQKCQDLEQMCQEKDAQLQAVSNNRTILQTAVQSALKQREAELEHLKQEHGDYRSQVNSVVEDLMRQQALQEAQRLRQKLASDGTRLGRIVYTRAGMRSVESWEEGTASRQLLERRKVLQTQLEGLEKRQEKARAAEQAFGQRQQQAATKENQHKSSSKNNESSSSPPVAEGIPLETPLDALEALESVRLHIENVQRKLYDLEQEEKRLKDEKVEHIQALKRVASEDSSRFRQRPKVRKMLALIILLLSFVPARLDAHSMLENSLYLYYSCTIAMS